MPIIDYHCHLSPKMIAENYKFKNAYDLFFGGDHYKWRQRLSKLRHNIQLAQDRQYCYGPEYLEKEQQHSKHEEREL